MPPLPPLNTHVNGDENAVRACAAALRTVAQGAQSGSDAFTKAKNDSEHWWPKGQGADAFRARMAPMSTGAGRVSEEITKVARGLDTFAESLAAVKGQMLAARGAAQMGTLTVTGETIEGPDMPMPRGQSAMEAIKMTAYLDAGRSVQAARKNEAAAHTVLGDLLQAKKTALHELNDQKWWILGGTSLDGVGRLVEGARKWSTAAEKEAAKAAKWEQDLAKLHFSPDDPALTRLADAAGTAEAGATKAATKAASFEKLLPISQDGKIADAVTATARSIPGIGEKLGAIGDKIPGLGAGLLAVQTGVDVSNAQGGVEKAKAAGADLGDFVVGTGVTEGLLIAGMAGGPATLGAVAIGAGVAWGVGEAVHHWSDITGFVGDVF